VDRDPGGAFLDGAALGKTGELDIPGQRRGDTIYESAHGEAGDLHGVDLVHEVLAVVAHRARPHHELVDRGPDRHRVAGFGAGAAHQAALGQAGSRTGVERRELGVDPFDELAGRFRGRGEIERLVDSTHRGRDRGRDLANGLGELGQCRHGGIDGGSRVGSRGRSLLLGLLQWLRPELRLGAAGTITRRQGHGRPQRRQLGLSGVGRLRRTVERRRQRLHRLGGAGRSVFQLGETAGQVRERASPQRRPSPPIAATAGRRGRKLTAREPVFPWPERAEFLQAGAARYLLLARNRPDRLLSLRSGEAGRNDIGDRDNRLKRLWRRPERLPELGEILPQDVRQLRIRHVLEKIKRKQRADRLQRSWFESSGLDRPTRPTPHYRRRRLFHRRSRLDDSSVRHQGAPVGKNDRLGSRRRKNRRRCRRNLGDGRSRGRDRHSRDGRSRDRGGRALILGNKRDDQRLVGRIHPRVRRNGEKPPAGGRLASIWIDRTRRDGEGGRI
jgi:hypothetical protein